MEAEQIVPYFLIMLVVVAIVVIFNQSLLSSGFPQQVSGNLTNSLVISMSNQVLLDGFGPARITYAPLASAYEYDITLTPELKLTGSGSVDVISIIRFKGRGIRATVLGSGTQDDKFTISDEDIGTPNLRAEIFSDIPPITSHAEYSGLLASGTTLLIKDGSSAMLAKVKVDRRYKTFLSEGGIIDSLIFDCLATFELECANGPIVYSSRLKGCESGGPQSDCEEDVELCGGTVHIFITGKPDCSRNTVEVGNLKYTDGREWPNVGENVYVSFWKDTVCTRRTADFLQLVALCPEDRLGGEFRLVHDLLTPP